MIEVIYKKEDGQEGSEESNTSDQVILPKNIRQIGDPGTHKKIYIEDYIVTYLNKLAVPSNSYSRGAILLGKVNQVGDGQVIFISGAIEAQNLELDLDETVFTNETWAEIYRCMNEYFPKLEIVGWFLSRLGFSTELSSKILKTHIDNFPGQNKILYMIDALEEEDTFYIYENENMKKQRGYYIYYERNDAMQNYMIKQNEITSPKTKEMPRIIRRDQEVVNNYRKSMSASAAALTNKNKQNEERPKFFYVASTFLTIAILAMGINILNNHDKMKVLEYTVAQMRNQDPSDGEQVPVMNQSTGSYEDTTAQSSEEINTTAAEPDAAKPETNTENQPVISTPKKAEVHYYTVKEGDTIIGISKKMYKSPHYVKQILKVNQLKATDNIFPGQKLIIPNLN